MIVELNLFIEFTIFEKKTKKKKKKKNSVPTVERNPLLEKKKNQKYFKLFSRK